MDDIIDVYYLKATGGDHKFQQESLQKTKWYTCMSAFCEIHVLRIIINTAKVYAICYGGVK